MQVLIYAFVRDEGSVVVFAGTVVETGHDVYLAVDHRSAEPIARALDYEEPLVEVEAAQILANIPIPRELTSLRQTGIVREQ